MAKITLNNAIHNIEAIDVNLSKSSFDSSSLAETSFRDVSLTRSTVNNCLFDSIVVEGTTLTNARFRNTNFAGVIFEGCDFANATIDGVAVSDLLAAHQAAKSVKQT